MTTRTVVIVGTGALARTVCTSLAGSPDVTSGADDVPIQVTIVGRRAARARDLVRQARPRRPVRLASHPADIDGAAAMARVVASYRPDVVLQCASWHSPWEGERRPSAWTDLLADAGFGLTLPVQAAPAAHTAAVLPDECAFVNGCLPDVANAALHGLGLPVLCGIGNAATLWSGLGGPDFRLLAHHVHLHRPAEPADEARAWRGDEPVGDIAELLADVRSLSRRALNGRAGISAALLVRHLVSGAPVRLSLPGPLGLPGGYPVVVRDRRIALDLPAAVSPSEAVAWNQRMCELDGVVVHPSGRVVFAEPAARALTPYLPQVAAGFDLDELASIAQELLRLRDRLRREPAQGADGHNAGPRAGHYASGLRPHA